MKKNRHIFIISLLLLITAILATFNVLLLTGVIKHDSKNSKESDSAVDQKVTQKDDKSDSDKTNEPLYYEIINEYKNAIHEEFKGSDGYTYANWNAVSHIIENNGTNLAYAFIDINSDGKDEMLIGQGFEDNGYSIVDIFSYTNGLNNLFEENSACLAETRCHVTLYDGGTIYFDGSGGASIHGYDFYTLDNNGKIIHNGSFESEYLENGDVIITDLLEQNKLDIKEIKPVVEEFTKGQKIVNIEKLNWKKIA